MTYGSNYRQTKCVHPDRPVMKLGKCLIWAGPANEMDHQPGWLLRIRLTDSLFMYPPSSAVKSNEAALALLSENVTKYQIPSTIDVLWDDYGTPDVRGDWWHYLVRDLKKLDGDVAIYCTGGHGRTGTALSIIAGLTFVTKGDPVAWVRKRYCEHCVESFAQINYIQEVLQRNIKSDPHGWGWAQHGTPTTIVGKDGTTATVYSAKPSIEEAIRNLPLKPVANSSSVVDTKGLPYGGHGMNPGWDTVLTDDDTEDD